MDGGKPKILNGFPSGQPSAAGRNELCSNPYSHKLSRRWEKLDTNQASREGSPDRNSTYRSCSTVPAPDSHAQTRTVHFLATRKPTIAPAIRHTSMKPKDHM